MNTRNGWHMLVIPATAPDDADYRVGPRPGNVYRRREGELLLPARDTAQELDRVRQLIGSFNYAAQYQQDPVPASGNLIRREWLRYFTKEPRSFDRKIVSWDTASTTGPRSSFSVGVVMGLLGLNYYVLEVIRGRYDPAELRRLVIETHRLERAHATLIEATDHGRLLVRSLRASQELAARAVPIPRRSKGERLSIEAPKFEAGQVWLPEEAPWLARYVAELVGFPNAPHDDQVDGTTQALAHLTRFHKPARPDPAGLYGPHGRRTRASLTRRPSKPASPQCDADVVVQDDGDAPVGPIFLKKPAEWEPDHEQGPIRKRPR